MPRRESSSMKCMEQTSFSNWVSPLLVLMPQLLWKMMVWGKHKETLQKSKMCAEFQNENICRQMALINSFLQFAQCLKITQDVSFEFWHFSPIFVLLKLTCLVTLFDRKLQFFKTIFGIFNYLLYIQNVNVARFARNVE